MEFKNFYLTPVAMLSIFVLLVLVVLLVGFIAVIIKKSNPKKDTILDDEEY